MAELTPVNRAITNKRTVHFAEVPAVNLTNRTEDNDDISLLDDCNRHHMFVYVFLEYADCAGATRGYGKRRHSSAGPSDELHASSERPGDQGWKGPHPNYGSPR